MITLQTAQNALKNVYLEAISNQLNSKVDPVFNMIKQSSADVYGRNIIKLVPFGVNGGVGAGDEDGQLPESMGNKYVNFTSTLKNLYGTIEISDKAIRASNNDEGAFVNLLSAEMDGLLQSSKFNISRMFYGDGTGSLSTISAVDSVAKTITVANSYAFAEGMLLDFYLSDVLDSDLKGVEVLKVDHSTSKVYLSKVSATLIAANLPNYVVCVQGSKGNELTGLGALFNTSAATLYGVTRADYKSLMPYRYGKSNLETFDEQFVQKMLDNVEVRSNYQPNVILLGGSMIYTLMTALAGYSVNLDTKELKGGFTSVSFSGVPVIRNKFDSANTMIMLNTDCFTLHQLCDWEWLNNNDGSILKQKEGYATYSATLVKYADLICDRPNAQAYIYDLAL